ncbi:MAG: hypothetical protein KDJ97_31700, partial [Anaerolineae bacterium]|nr:hypothetical protein [Anaerolineae bacterium]
LIFELEAGHAVFKGVAEVDELGGHGVLLLKVWPKEIRDGEIESLGAYQLTSCILDQKIRQDLQD